MSRNKRIEDFEDIFTALEPIYYAIISGNNGVHAKKSYGSTHPVLVRRAIRAEEKWLKSAYSNLK